MGPLALLDLIGLDTAYEILDTMYKQTRDRLHAPAPIIKQMVTAGVKGRKTGRGFYTYEAPGSPVVVADAQTPVPNGDDTVTRPVQRVGVVGSGTMAVGIAEVFCKAGYDVVLRARGTEQIDKARASISGSLEKAVVRGKVTEAERDEALGRFSGSTSFDDLADCDLFVEATVEELSVKQADLRHARRARQARCDPGDHDVEPAGRRDRLVDVAYGRRRRHALLQPGTGHEAGRGGAHHQHLAGGRRHRS